HWPIEVEGIAVDVFVATASPTGFDSIGPLGPALGGMRMRSYLSPDEALQDCLNLARGMRYKHLVAGTPYDGGKLVIIARQQDFPRGSNRRQQLFQIVAEHVESLNGTYITAEDLGTWVDDIVWVNRFTRHVCGVPVGGWDGDPSPYTESLCYKLLVMAARRRLGSSTKVADLRVAVEGLGKTGGRLAARLLRYGASVTVADKHPPAIRRFLGKIPMEARGRIAFLNPDWDERDDRPFEDDELAGIAFVPADVYAPCAAGGTLTDIVAENIPADVVCGPANNQFANGSARAAQILFDRNKLVVPDIVANAGGIIAVHHGLVHGADFSRKVLREDIERAVTRGRQILNDANRRGLPPELYLHRELIPTLIAERS
ncbi:MAG: Glu/Leu/Phe/Val dehydrogenase, partial [Bdellovibrionales bacterium]|nr:Glu/Leu/Phe/Val dehydrogenase [Bdellovibrionales bacterium]